MRMFLISLAIACVLCLPKIGMVLGFDVPGGGWLALPAVGLGFLLVFFHEIGHTVSYWIFGYPAIPSFDFEDGGGYTHALSRSWIVLAAVWAGAAGLAWRLWQAESFALLGWLAGGLALHGLLVATGGDMVVTGFAGHAGEVLVAAFCLLRAFMGTTEKSRGAAERWLNMVFGCFVLVYDTFFCTALMFNRLYRADYAAQKGGHLEGDLDRIALTLGVPIGAVAFFLLVFTLCVFVAAIFIGMRHMPHEDHVQSARKAARRRVS